MSAAALGTLACQADLPEPELDGFDPSVLYNGEQTLVIVRGRHFYPTPRVQAVPSAEAPVDAAFALRLDGDDASVTLAPRWRSVESLEVTVPAGLAVGSWDATLIDPAGRSVSTPDAITVSDVRPDRLVLEISPPVAEVNQPVSLGISVVDTFDRLVPTPLPVRVAVEGAAAGVQFGDALGAQVPLDDGVGVRGLLGLDGRAAVPLTLSVPGQVTVAVAQHGDDAVRGDRGAALWLAGSELRVEIGLPNPDFETTAGETFPVSLRLRDQFGNAVDNTRQAVVVRDTCGAWVAPVTIDGPTQVDATLTRATDATGCLENRIEVVSGPPGSSELVRVLPGPADALRVIVAPTRVVAGAELGVFVLPTDAWGNQADWSGSVRLIRDSAAGVGDWECSSGVPVFCTVRPRRAGSSLFLQVDGFDGVTELTGRSNGFSVSAGPFSTLAVASAGPAVAGAPFVLSVSPTDEFGNPVDALAVGGESLVASRAGEPGFACTPGLVTPTELRLNCIATRAGAGAVTLVHPDTGATATVPLTVAPGPLSRVDVVSDGTTVVAGESLSVHVSGEDAWGNAVSSGTVDLASSEEPGASAVVTLDGAGVGSTRIVLERAGTTYVTGSSGGVEIGRSSAVLVSPAAPERLRLTVGAAWAWVDEVVDLRVEAVDPFGNRAPVDAPVTLSTASGEGALPSLALNNGVAVGPISWVVPVDVEVITALAAGLSGDSDPFVVVAACAGRPAPTIVARGSADERACTDADGTANYLVSVGSPGANRWLASVDGGVPVDARLPGFGVSTHGVGRHRLDVIAVEPDGCAGEASVDLWTGPDDGRPVGPLTVSLARDTAGVADPATGTVAVTITDIVDCTGDPATGAPVVVRVDRGRVERATPTGSGLTVTADAFGSGDFTWSFLDASTGGDALVRVVAGDGAAAGAASLVAVGDLRRPRVWDQSPLGAYLELIDSVTLAFSEALLPQSVSPSAFEVAGPVVMPIAVTAAALGADGRSVEISVSPPIDPALGQFVVQARPQLRDLAGNRLDGGFVGAASTWGGPIGTPGTPPSLVSCGVDVPRFRPDGDDGLGEEADRVLFSWSASSTPTWWMISVYSDNTLVRREWRTPAGPTDAWLWDGRDSAERVQEDGVWELRVSADDGFGNRSAPCAIPVTLANED